MAQLIHAGAPPHVVQHLLDAGAAAGIEAALLVGLARLAHAGRGRGLQPGLGLLLLLADGALDALRSFGTFGPLGALHRPLRALCGPLRGGRDDGGGSELLSGLDRLDGLLSRLHAEARQVDQYAPGRAILDLHVEQAAGERLNRLLDRHGVVGQQPRAHLLHLPAVQTHQPPILRQGDVGRAWPGNQPFARRALRLDHLGQGGGRRGEDHVGVHDVGVAVADLGGVVFVRADLVVVARVRPQVEQAVAAQLAHARLKVAQFVFVRHDPDVAVVLIRFSHVFRAAEGFAVADNQRTNPEIKLLRVVLL